MKTLEDIVKDQPLIDQFETYEELRDFLLEHYSYNEVEASCITLLCEELKLTIEDIGNVKINGDYYFIYDRVYLMGTDETLDKYWEDELDSYLEDVIYSEIPNYLLPYFDEEKWKDDARLEGRAHALAKYDGNELLIIINNEDYYGYRIN